MKKIYATLIAALGVFAFAHAEDITKKGEITSSESWTKDNVYILDGFVTVVDGVTLTIEAGTIIKGYASDNISSGDVASALIVARGGKIMAEGTESDPIIFTSELDDVSDNKDLDLTRDEESRGLWGGVVVLGRAPIGSASNEATVEGLPETDNSLYGGDKEDDDSGVMKYVSIRHGGFELSADNEINGLTLGGVGNKTVLEHIEVIYNADDGIEFFGGSVNLKWATVAYCGDDGFDWDLGWRGKGQFWFAYGGTEAGDHGGEFDGASPDHSDRYANPTIYNFTFIGGWDGKVTNAKNDHAILLRDGSAGTLANGIVYGYNSYALQVEDRGEEFDSYTKMKNGELNLKNNIWYAFGSGNSWDDALLATSDKCTDCDLVELKKHLTTNNNEIMNPGIDRTAPVPNKWSYAATKEGDEEPDSWFTDVDYIGAFAPGLASESPLAAWGAFFEYSTVTSDERFETIQTGIYPNPSNGSTNITFNMEDAGSMNITLADLNGKMVSVVANKNFNAGANQVELNVANLEPGVYFINFSTSQATATRKLIVE